MSTAFAKYRATPNATIRAAAHEPPEPQPVVVNPPRRQWWVRTAEAPLGAYNLVRLEEELGKTYFFAGPEVLEVLATDVRQVELHAYVTQQGTEGLWPIDIGGRNQSFVRAERYAISAGRDAWVRIVWSHERKARIPHPAQDQTTVPQWSGRSAHELLESAFAGKAIDDLDHPVARRLLGRRPR